MAAPARATRVRLAELVATLSLGTDLGMGQPMEHVLRQSLIALRLARAARPRRGERAVVYYVGLLAWVGCHTDAYEQAKWFGDDLALKADTRHVDMTAAGRGGVRRCATSARGGRWLERARLGVAFLGDGLRAVEDMLENHWLADERARRAGSASGAMSATASTRRSSAGTARACRPRRRARRSA